MAKIDGATTEALPIAPSLAPTLEAADLAGHSTLVDFVLRIPRACELDCDPLLVPALPDRDSAGPGKP